MRQTRVLIIALCLACFAISAWSIARTNRASAASFSVGTTEVATVTPRGVGLQEAVDRADPRARFAMAAVSVVTPSSRLLAVDASRMPAVMAWPRGISRATLATAARRLRPPTAPAVNLPNARLRLTADTTFTGGPETSLRNLDLNLWTFNPQVGATIVDLGFLRPGPWTYQADVAGSCPGGCRLAGLGVIPAPGRNAPSSGAIHLGVSHLAVGSAPSSWTPIAADLFPHGWLAAAGGIQVRSNGTAGLTFVVPASAAAAYAGATAYASSPMASPADHPGPFRV